MQELTTGQRIPLEKFEFKAEIFQLAFGENAINKGYSEEEVLEVITKQTQELAAFYEETIHNIEANLDEDDYTEEDFEYVERLTNDIETFRNGE